MLTTATGHFPIGMRRGWTDWQKDLGGLIHWCRENKLGVLDIGGPDEAEIKQIVSAGLKVGTVNLPEWATMISPDKATREEAVRKNAAAVEKAAKAGAKNVFAVMLPQKPELPRKENHAFMVESMKALAPALEKSQAQVVIEGWPGPGALCCTPEGYRALFTAVPSRSMGINYDPSHLLRMGIDPIRFLHEFGDRVYHVHGKDTEIMSEAMYEFGHELPATLAKGRGFGGHTWRYTIPGHGSMRWREGFKILESKGFKGAVTIELEDENYNGTEEGEKRGLLAGAAYLASC